MSGIIADPIHGDVELSDQEFKIVNTGSFQRLRYLKQLGMTHLTYPNATHTRFAHSIGVLATMKRILERVEPAAATKEQREDLRLAALLHDIGHYPYSHLMERVDRVMITEERVGKQRSTLSGGTAYPNHEEVGRMILASQRDLLEAIGGKAAAEKIAAIFCRTEATDPQLSKLIHSSLDMDRLDYLLRDARAAGVPYGIVDIDYLLNHVRMSKSGMLGVERKALSAVEHFLLARFFMHKAVYYHKTTYGLEECCRQLLRRIRDSDPKGEKFGVPTNGEAVRRLVESSKLSDFNDAFVDKVIHEATHNEDEVISSLAHAIYNRQPPKLIKEVSVLEASHQKQHAGALFLQNCKFRISEIADYYKIPLGCFLICDPKALNFEVRPRWLSAAEARSLPPEEREEVIMIFNDSEEPVPIVDVATSIVQPLSQLSYQVCRLYLVFPVRSDAARFDQCVAEIRQATKGWEA